MPNTYDFYKFLDSKYPYSSALEYDNSGIIFALDDDINKVLVSLDITENVIKEAKKLKADLIISHHPLSLEKITGVTTNTANGKILALLIKNKINAISVHTNLDVAVDGVNDVLAETLNIINTKTFCNKNGEILGKIGTSHSKFLTPLYELIKEKLKVEVIRAFENSSKIEKVAVIGGSGSSFIFDAKIAGADTLITGDCKHSSFLEAKILGINLIDAGHFNTETLILEKLCINLNKKFKNVNATVAASNENIVKFI